MPHDTSLIATIVAGITIAFVLGAIAQRVKVSPLAGYLLAGVAIGPFTPGFVADLDLAFQLAEIGVILLMFGVGLHFSFRELASVRRIAVPGALAQIAIAVLLGLGLSALLGWSLAEGLLFGFALSVASTVVLLRALQERRLIQSEEGQIAVGWLIVEDLAMVLALVLLPPIANALLNDVESANVAQQLATTVGLTLAKVTAFAALMYLVARRAIPLLLHYIAHTGSRELFRLAVLAIALGTAFGAATLFDVSFALGAFFAGMILAESPLSQRAAEETLPLRDAFAVLFFVSVGMLFDPAIVLREPAAVAATVLIVVVGKSLAAYGIVRAFGHPNRTALTISASLAQIGEFSFILAGLGLTLGLMSEVARDLILAGAMLSIVANPAIFVAASWLNRRLERRQPATPEVADSREAEVETRSASLATGHAVLIGYGRVGRVIAEGLRARGLDAVIVDEASDNIAAASEAGWECFDGNAVDDELLQLTNVAQASILYVAIPDGFEAGQIAAKSKALNPGLKVIARAHSDAEAEHLGKYGADRVVMGEREIALGMIEAARLPAEGETAAAQQDGDGTGDRKAPRP
ncbi:MAG: YbaL family putative K(+) efflux transporter [Rhodovibrionaceae bacterium]